MKHSADLWGNFRLSWKSLWIRHYIIWPIVHIKILINATLRCSLGQANFVLVLMYYTDLLPNSYTCIFSPRSVVTSTVPLIILILRTPCACLYASQHASPWLCLPLYGKYCKYATFAKFSNTEKQMPECPALSLWENWARVKICKGGCKHSIRKEKQATEQEEVEWLGRRGGREAELVSPPTFTLSSWFFWETGVYFTKGVIGM